MKLIIILLFFSLSTQAQTLTTLTTKQLTGYTAKLSDSVRAQAKLITAQATAIASLKAWRDMKNKSDDDRNAKIKGIEDRVDSTGWYMSFNDFDADSINKVISI